MNEYEKFKHLLEYFVTHLEWVLNSETSNRGYEKYLKPLIDKNEFYSTGQGYKHANIQNHVNNWSEFKNGQVFINIQANYGNYKTVKCYLNWADTGLNVIARWKGNQISSLALEEYQWWLKPTKRVDLSINKTIEELGLFDNNAPNSNLNTFFDKFNSLIINWKAKEFKKQIMAYTAPYKQLLEETKNLILTGAPGTGKTYLAREIAESLNAEVEFVQFHPSYDYTDFVEGLRPFKKAKEELGFELKDGIFKTFCKKALQNFLDSRKSEEELKREDIVRKKIDDFLDKCIDEGRELILSTGNKFKISEYNTTQIMVNVPNNAITFDLNLPLNELFQLFLNDCKLTKVKDIREFFGRTHNRQSDSYIFTIYNGVNSIEEYKTSSEIAKIDRKNYVLIIDEINRAEISKVFGELFFSIDPGYRGEKGKVKTQYSNLQDDNDVFFDGFYIPENVYIIGTMNDIDRSVESFDFAMRRRFTWMEINAKESAERMNLPIAAINKMNNLNERISITEGLNTAYHIGPAYFLDVNGKPREDFENIWNLRIAPLLTEYLRGLPDGSEKIESLKIAFES